MQLNLNLHDKQAQIWNAAFQFIVVSAGRRGGKSHLVAAKLIEQVCLTELHGRTLTTNNAVFYGAPSRDQAKRMIWAPLKEITANAKKYFTFKEKDLIVTFEPTGRQILCMGLDNPDAPRGSSFSYAAMDEYPLIKPEAWELSVSPALTDCDGGAMFIGTPDPKQLHFEKLWNDANEGLMGEEWGAFNFGSIDNPWGPSKKVIAQRKKIMTKDAFAREFLGKFASSSEGLFADQYLTNMVRPPAVMGTKTYMAVDLAGFDDGEAKTLSAVKKRDEHAIAIVAVGANGWHVLDIQHGRWGVRETAQRIVQAYRQYRPRAVGIEKGSLKNAVSDYLSEYQREYNTNFKVHALTHGNKKKTERILWVLQGRIEKGRISLAEGRWNKPLIDQLSRFPSAQSHDDLIDALAYIDQISKVQFRTIAPSSYLEDNYLDLEAGY